MFGAASTISQKNMFLCSLVCKAIGLSVKSLSSSCKQQNASRIHHVAPTFTINCSVCHQFAATESRRDGLPCIQSRLPFIIGHPGTAQKKKEATPLLVDSCSPDVANFELQVSKSVPKNRQEPKNLIFKS